MCSDDKHYSMQILEGFARKYFESGNDATRPVKRLTVCDYYCSVCVYYLLCLLFVDPRVCLCLLLQDLVVRGGDMCVFISP